MLFNFIMHKRKSFEHERELRAVFWEMSATTDAQPYKAKIEDLDQRVEHHPVAGRGVDAR